MGVVLFTSTNNFCLLSRRRMYSLGSTNLFSCETRPTRGASFFWGPIKARGLFFGLFMMQKKWGEKGLSLGGRTLFFKGPRSNAPFFREIYAGAFPIRNPRGFGAVFGGKTLAPRRDVGPRRKFFSLPDFERNPGPAISPGKPEIKTHPRVGGNLLGGNKQPPFLGSSGRGQNLWFLAPRGTRKPPGGPVMPVNPGRVCRNTPPGTFYLGGGEIPRGRASWSAHAAPGPGLPFTRVCLEKRKISCGCNLGGNQPEDSPMAGLQVPAAPQLQAYAAFHHRPPRDDAVCPPPGKAPCLPDAAVRQGSAQSAGHADGPAAQRLHWLGQEIFGFWPWKTSGPWPWEGPGQFPFSQNRGNALGRICFPRAPLRER